jgi:hypothetical protein
MEYQRIWSVLKWEEHLQCEYYVFRMKNRLYSKIKERIFAVQLESTSLSLRLYARANQVTSIQPSKES